MLSVRHRESNVIVDLASIDSRKDLPGLATVLGVGYKLCGSVQSSSLATSPLARLL